MSETTIARGEAGSAASGDIIREIEGLAEMEEVFRIRDEVFVHEQRLTNDARHDPDHRTSIHYLAWRDGQPLGTGRLTLHGREAQVAWVAVRPEARGSGLGKAVMEAIIERADQERAAYIVLNAQTHAITFYEQLGFEIVGPEFTMGGIGHRVMIRRSGDRDAGRGTRDAE
ncbi:MAG TPA: GNAT family N-acetyltransferase [Thermomicrobiales bacterium]|nr:GNAT family N-acetyltransferase [Thermomicrobiales bacterium]